MNEEINVRDYRGNYKKLRISGNQMYLGKSKFDFTLKKLMSMVNLYGLEITRPYNNKRSPNLNKESKDDK